MGNWNELHKGTKETLNLFIKECECERELDKGNMIRLHGCEGYQLRKRTYCL